MKKAILFIATLAIHFNLQSQVSISSSNMPISGDTARYSEAVLTSIGNYSVTGANYTWNFSALQPTGQYVRYFQPSLSTPYFFYFLPPKYGEKTMDSLPIPAIPGNPITIKDIYSFYRKNGTASFNAQGLGLSLSGIPIGANYTDEDELYLLPLNYGNRDSTTFKLSTPSSTLIPLIYKKQGYRITQADGWGTITTPYGTSACLRVTTTQYSQDTILISSLPSPFNKLGFPNITRSYQWLTLGEKIPYFEVTGNMVGSVFVPTQARYRDVKRVFVGVEEYADELALSVFPNPASQQLTVLLPYSLKPVALEIADLNGKIIKTYVLEQNTGGFNPHQLDVSGLTPGIYLLSLNKQSGKQTLKISIQ